jgi:glycosyltransferase involved in cell wall biosynthesis
MRRATTSAPGSLRVHALIDSLTWGGAEMLLGDMAVGAPECGLELSVGYLVPTAELPAAERLRRQGIEPTPVPIEGLLRPAALRRVRMHLRALAPDVVHTHLEYADTLGGLAARSLRIPTVSTLHVMEWGTGPREGTKARLAALARRACAARVIAVSDAARAAYLERRWDSPRHVVTIRNGSAARPAPGAGRALRAELGLDPGDVVIALVGVLREGKGHEVAAAAVRALRSRFPRLRLLVAGDGPYRGEVEAIMSELGDAAVMCGHRDDVMAVLDASDVLVHPSRVDAFPTSLLEAMAAGLPIVATAVGGIPEIVEHGSSGLLLGTFPRPQQLAEALEGLLADESRRREMGERGRERFEREFGVWPWCRRLRALYEEVLGR